jgi:hypothetical protein
MALVAVALMVVLVSDGSDTGRNDHGAGRVVLVVLVGAGDGAGGDGAEVE